VTAFRCGPCGSPSPTWRETVTGFRACETCAEVLSAAHLFAPWGPEVRAAAVYEIWQEADKLCGRCRTSMEPEMEWIGRTRKGHACAACAWIIEAGSACAKLGGGAGRKGRMTWYLCAECSAELVSWGGRSLPEPAAAACPF